MAITDWPADERPREKLLARGATALSDAELLAIFLRVGIRGQSAVDLARALLLRFGSLTRMCSAGAQDFAAVPGMGLAKYAQLQAVMELSRRALRETLSERPLFDAPQVVRDWLRLRLGHLPHETFCVMLLDARHCLIEAVDLFRGTLTQITEDQLRKNISDSSLEHNCGTARVLAGSGYTYLALSWCC
jgi:DNA repair protein RadC